MSYLLEDTPESRQMCQKLMQLIQSKEEANVFLAHQIMTGAGMPDRIQNLPQIYSEVVLAYHNLLNLSDNLAKQLPDFQAISHKFTGNYLESSYELSHKIIAHLQNVIAVCYFLEVSEKDIGALERLQKHLQTKSHHFYSIPQMQFLGDLLMKVTHQFLQKEIDYQPTIDYEDKIDSQYRPMISLMHQILRYSSSIHLHKDITETLKNLLADLFALLNYQNPFFRYKMKHSCNKLFFSWQIQYNSIENPHLDKKINWVNNTHGHPLKEMFKDSLLPSWFKSHYENTDLHGLKSELNTPIIYHIEEQTEELAWLNMILIVGV
jgi:hypothetical protein